MDSDRSPTSLLESLGEEIIRIVTPVSACMFLVVLLVTLLNASPSSFSSPYVSTIATMAYTEITSDSSWDKFKGALLNSLVFVAVVTVATFVLVLLFYLRCTRFLKFYMGFSAFAVMGFMGGEIALLLIRDFNFPIDCVTFLIVLYNFAAVGTVAVFMPKMPIFVTQAYLVVIGMLVAYWFTLLPEWTTWVLLVAMSLYDLAAVLLPGGPLRLLVELAISRDEDIPALVYEARPITYHKPGSVDSVVQRRVWRERGDGFNVSGNAMNSTSGSDSNSVASLDSVSTPNTGTYLSVGTEQHERRLLIAEEAQVVGGDSALSVPLIDSRMTTQSHSQEGAISSEVVLEGMGLGSSGAIKLGLGDFIFYSVLVGRAAMYDLMTVYACYLAIIAGLGITLILLAFFQKALPALPVSVILGVLFYVLTRTLLEVFVVQCSLNLLLF